MANEITRRTWIKSGALLAGSFAFISGAAEKLLAAPVFRAFKSTALTDKAAVLSSMPELKARLLANENPFGPSDKAKKAIQDAIANSYQYPFLHFSELTSKIAAYEGLNEDQIALDAGSTPVLHAAAMYFSKDGGSIICGDPTYDDLIRCAADFGGKIVKVPLTSEYKLDLDAMEKKIDSGTKLIYICNPNNPTATVLDTTKLKDFVERVSKKVTVFIDEAYIDYLPDPKSSTLFDAVKKGQNVLVARTFSKLYGFAGLRVGYVASSKEMLQKLSIYTVGDQSISAPAIMAALAAYQDQAFLQEAFKKTMASKEFLYKTLKAEGYDYIPSSTNFVMFQLKMDGRKFSDEMMKRGVGIRYWKFNDKDWCRVSIGRMDEMQAFAEAFKQLS
ncbi:aminotransferase class I/II-fold pyridoxal phosphate-dependent enzyme [Pedobacter sp. HMF7647]|uniref:Aminotransferase class I/II-fold pyridoxal phosphate-dependent enzyme n=1 Tax=Hufsiella arboris TaxID=2695275 RepID=A0A7K1Y727_9SPHI|nr:histidinol-phosphate transaminase [Hufsiella arboris]MXV49919.1 aminotransferase class I/II-fold pyridoxal phosphate-dependent enzyme [Hufsiella arboris]